MSMSNRDDAPLPIDEASAAEAELRSLELAYLRMSDDERDAASAQFDALLARIERVARTSAHAA